MKIITSVHLSPMYGISSVLLTYKEGICYSFMEEKGIIETLCVKYQIISKGNECYDSRHLVGKKCRLAVKDGTTIFLGYRS
jgi:uncharacterized iron-regulated protein